MTGQIPDLFYYEDHQLDLVGIRGDKLPIPSDFGIETVMASTACWRGYVMRYKIIENYLVLDGFRFNSRMDNYPKINGREPESGDQSNSFFSFEYKNLNKKIAFTGSIWLAKDFIRSEYVHMGFQSPTAYKTVIKFDFEGGVIVNVEDKSKEIKKARRKRSCKEPKPPSMNPIDLAEWIHKRFSLDIDHYKKKRK
ncbi:MAG: hypothetical protein BAJALOKI2v1_70025 [Promethearchaeota archaeon]|nr:MAG: hypothetical protein BAJALOKI2v1_70025 [Candidatus Lokiarchaeota archaeon]